MPVGLITRDASGNVMLDTTTKLMRILGVQAITFEDGDGSVTPAGTDRGELFAVELPAFLRGQGYVTLTVTATTVSWSWSQFVPSDAAAIILYGLK